MNTISQRRIHEDWASFQKSYPEIADMKPSGVIMDELIVMYPANESMSFWLMSGRVVLHDGDSPQDAKALIDQWAINGFGIAQITQVNLFTGALQRSAEFISYRLFHHDAGGQNAMQE